MSCCVSIGRSNAFLNERRVTLYSSEKLDKGTLNGKYVAHSCQKVLNEQLFIFFTVEIFCVNVSILKINLLREVLG